ncbi:MAG: hypothetical protein RIF41_10400, partial [Polyangiaceae bacterium]
GLLLTVVIDDDTTLTNVDGRMLHRWDVPFERVVRRALDNLASRSAEPYLAVGPGLWLAPWEDGHAAARLLCPPPRATDLVAAIPDHDVLLLADARVPDALDALAYALDGLERTSPLTEQLFRLRRLDDGLVVTPYDPPSSHPAAGLLRERRIEETVSHYDAQRWPLQQVVGDDVYVASANTLRDDDGRLTSFALWTERVDTLLPTVDRVHLLETGPDGESHRLWATDLESLSSLPEAIVRVGCPLTRWRTGRFPDATELRRVATPLELDVTLKRAS